MQKPRRVILCLLVVQVLETPALRMEGEPAAWSDQKAASQPTQALPKSEEPAHRFWDSTNIAVFLGVGGARGLDYASTRNFRSRGVDERLLSNSVVDNPPLFVAIEAAATAASIGVSYLFHRSGHHKLERWVSIVHISVGVGGSVRNYLLRSDSPPAPAR